MLCIVLLGAFACLQYLLPLSTAIKIGADEDFELAKAVLSLGGHAFYAEVWNDQPPLYVFLLAGLAKHFSSAVLWPRLLTVGCSFVLLSSVYYLMLRAFGLLAAAVATGLVVASPGFLELSWSCMPEIPALVPVTASLGVLVIGWQRKWRWNEALAGALFGVGLQMKLIGAVYLPLVMLILWLRYRGEASLKASLRRASRDLGVFGAAVLAVFLTINYLTGSPLLLQLRQAWESHVAPARSLERDSPAGHAFDWSVLPKNWDTTLPALVGVFYLLGRLRKRSKEEFQRSSRGQEALIRPRNPNSPSRRGDLSLLASAATASGVGVGPALLVAWVVLTLVVFGAHKPWWPYYYVHNAVPLCLCAGVGFAVIFEWALSRRGRSALVLGSLFAVCAAGWMGGRLYFEAAGIRRAPRIYSSLLLKEIERFKPFTRFLFTDQPIYSFHSGIPLPPKLGVISLKRFWSGDMTEARLIAELDAAKPELILLANDNAESIYQERIDRDYRLVYQDSANRLYAHRSIANKARYD